MVGALDNPIDEFVIDLGEYEKEFTDINSIQYDMDRNFIVDINQTLYRIRYGMDIQKDLGVKE